MSKKELNHPRLAASGCPAERGRTELLISRVQLSAMLDEDRGVFHVALLSEAVQRRDAEPIRLVCLHAVSKQKLGDLPRFAPDSSAFRQVGLIAEQQPDERFVALPGSALQPIGLVGRHRIGCDPPAVV